MLTRVLHAPDFWTDTLEIDSEKLTRNLNRLEQRVRSREEIVTQVLRGTEVSREVISNFVNVLLDAESGVKKQASNLWQEIQSTHTQLWPNALQQNLGRLSGFRFRSSS